VTGPFEIHNFCSGDSFLWAYVSSEFPASEWDSVLYFRGSTALEIEGVAEGDLHGYTLTSELSAELVAGYYTWSLVMTRDDE
jgi:hypothetical protein